MTEQRYRELEAAGGTLTPAEMKEGWHFCSDWDGLLIHPYDEEASACSHHVDDCECQCQEQIAAFLEVNPDVPLEILMEDHRKSAGHADARMWHGERL